MYYERKVLNCVASYRGGYIDLNIKDELNVYYHFDMYDTPISIWAVKYDGLSNHATHVVFMDKNKSPISNQAELNRMIACCQGRTMSTTTNDNKLPLVYSVIRVQSTNSKREILKGMFNE